jgi:hypothetical protein
LLAFVGVTVGLMFGAAPGGRGLGSRALLGAAWRLLLARKGPALGLLLVANVACAGAAQVVSPLATASTTLINYSYQALAAAVTALIAAFTLRLLLAPDSRWWRVDRSLGQGVSLITAAGLGATAAQAIGAALNPGPLDWVYGLLALIPVSYVCATMMLWPVGVLLEDREMPQALAVKQMRGNIQPYVVAYLLLMGGMVLAGLLILGLAALALHVNPKTLAHQLWLPFGALFGAFSVAQIALWAALYQSRKAAIPAVDLRGLGPARA